MEPRNTTISIYTWGVLTGGMLLILGAIWWASASGPAAPRSMAYAEPPSFDAAQDESTRPTSIRQAATPARLGTLPNLSSGITSGVGETPAVTVTPLLRPEQSRRAQARRPGSPFPDMFPVGSVAANAPRVAHPYMEVPELFGSFFHDRRMWSATGTFARADQLELAPIGREVDGRSVFALRSTVSPSTALFVRSKRDPNKYAVYR